jgi:hypothetical protein
MEVSLPAKGRAAVRTEEILHAAATLAKACKRPMNAPKGHLLLSEMRMSAHGSAGAALAGHTVADVHERGIADDNNLKCLALAFRSTQRFDHG